MATKSSSHSNLCGGLLLRNRSTFYLRLNAHVTRIVAVTRPLGALAQDLALAVVVLTLI
jgi:hypothetical protein